MGGLPPTNGTTDGKDLHSADGAASKDPGSPSGSFPSRDQCLQCHTAVALAARSVLSWRPLTATSSTAAERDFQPARQPGSHLKLCCAPAVAAAALALPDSTTAICRGGGARGYLHANCSICHCPNGSGQGPGRFSPFDAAGDDGGNADPSQGDLGVSGAGVTACWRGGAAR